MKEVYVVYHARNEFRFVPSLPDSFTAIPNWIAVFAFYMDAEIYTTKCNQEYPVR